MKRKAPSLCFVNRACIFLLAMVLAVSAAACGDKNGTEEGAGPVSGEEEDAGGVGDALGQPADAGVEGSTSGPAAGAEQPGGEEDADGESGAETGGGTGQPGSGGEDAGTSGVDSAISVQRVGIYTIDDETLETKSLTAMVNVKDGLTVDAVVDAVVLALADHSIEAVVDGISVDGGKVTVDLKAEEPYQPFGNASSVEGLALDCISYSIFDNFRELKEIYFTVNGEAYESGHISLPLGEPYLKKE